MKILALNIDALRCADYNPASRNQVENVSDLVASIEANGQLLPILVRPDGTIIDGHRRVVLPDIFLWAGRAYGGGLLLSG